MEKDIMKILTNYLRYWYLFLIGGAVCIALAFMYIRYKVVPEYSVAGKILLNDKEQGGAASGAEAFGDLGLLKVSRNITDEIGVLQSYDLMKSAVNEMGLSVGYFVEGRFSEVEIYEKQIPFKVVLNDSLNILQHGTVGSIVMVDNNYYKLNTTNANGDTKTTTYTYGENIETSFGAFSVVLNSQINKIETKPVFIEFRDIDALTLAYNQKLLVEPVSEEGGGLLQMSLTDAIPQRGVDLINTLIAVYARESAENKNRLAKTTLKIIDERLDLLTSELGSAEKDVEVYKQSNQLTDVSTDAARFMQLADATEGELTILRSQINALSSLESSVAQSNNQTSINSFNVQNPIIIGLISQYNEQLQKRQSLVRATGSGNPQLGEIDRQLQDLKSAIQGNVQSVKSVIVSEQNNLLSKSSGYRNRVSTVPTAERALLEINRDQGLKQSLYLYLLQKREEESLSMTSPFSDTRIIETPQATSYPVSPNKTSIYLGAFLFGLFAPFVWIFAKENLNTKISNPEDIKALTDTLLLGSIATSKQKETIVVGENNVSPASELFRLMRFNLKFISKGETNQVIMVTSGKQGEGKTFISINLGASLAITGKKVVVLGFDLRAPRLMKDLGLSNKSGITDYIVDRAIEVNDIIIPFKDIKNLHFIGSGTIPPNPGELMLSDRVGQLINTLKQSYDYVIIDTPPIGKVADAFSLRNFVDSALYIVRSNYTSKSEIKTINEIVESKKLESLMIVLNDMKMDKSETYGYGYKSKNE
jgi:tyrosine-protein kinase Etk/Wzc